MILHLAQILRTEERTFIFYLPIKSFIPVCDSAAGQVIRRQLNRDFIAGQYPYEIHSHFSGDMRVNLMTIFQFDTECRVWQGLQDDAIHLDENFFCQSDLVNRYKTKSKNAEQYIKKTIKINLFFKIILIVLISPVDRRRSRWYVQNAPRVCGLQSSPSTDHPRF